jgi:putative SOS response-associated peptidase YedK
VICHSGCDGKRDFGRMRWGLVPWWWSKPLKELRAATFNARAETVETKPFFRDAFKRSRCLIPASGYYEWKNEAGDKQPYYFTRAHGELAWCQQTPLLRPARDVGCDAPGFVACQAVHRHSPPGSSS